MRPEDRFSELAQLVRTQLDGGAPPGGDVRARARLIEQVARGPKRSSKKGRVVLALAFASALAGFAAWRLGEAPLAAHVGPEAVAQGAFLQASASPTTIDFSDGSQALLAPGANLRVEHLAPNGAALSLERGSVTLSVQGRGSAHWLVHAGPATVTVHGTVLDVAWSPESNDLAVRVDEGRVEVTTPTMPFPMSVAGGQLLHIRGADVTLGPTPLGTSAAPPPTAVTTAAPTLDAAPVPSVSAAALSPVPGPSSIAPESWTQRVASGDFAGVLAEAEARGLDAVLGAAPLGDLVALADAARYARRGDITGRALSAQRSRFPGTSAAASAAFLLGRAADDGGRTQEALGFYDRYLVEAPSGAFAAEALGRKLLAVERTSGASAARPLAEAYLARYPKGAHTAAARRLTSP